MYKELKCVKRLIELSTEFYQCTVNVFIEPSISSAIFIIDADDYHHIFKAPFGMIEIMAPETLARRIVTEVLDWRNKYES